MNHPFFVGGVFRDRAQGYEVISMTAHGMTIKFDDNTQRTINLESMKIKARIHNNMLAEYRVNHPVGTDRYYWSIGFLASNARFEAELPNHVVEKFLRQYADWSGESVSTDHPNVILLGDVDKYGAELRIYFPVPARDLDFGPDIEVRAGQSDGISRINNNALWFKLVRLGFRVGKKHIKNSIRNSIPDDKRHLFDEGVANS